MVRWWRPLVGEKAVEGEDVDDASNGGNEGKGRCQHFQIQSESLGWSIYRPEREVFTR